MTKLAIFTGRDIRFYGGGEKYAIELSNHLSEYDTTIFSSRGNDDLRLTLSDVKRRTNAEIKFYGALEIPILKDRMILTRSGVRTLLSLKEFDVIYNIDSSLLTNLLLTTFSKIYKKRYIYGLHDPGLLREVPLIKTTFRTYGLMIYSILRSFVIKGIPNIHVINSLDKKALEKIGYHGNVYFIPLFTYSEPRGLKLNDKRFVSLFVGRLAVYQKGIDLLAKVAENTLNKNTNINFHIVGSGDEGRDIITKLVAKFPKNVKWSGFLSDRKLVTAYENANLFLLSSRYEGFPTVILEAQSYGLPVIAFDSKGSTEVIKDAVQGSLVETFDIDEFSRLILKYYADWKSSKFKYRNTKSRILKYVQNRYGERVIMPKVRKMLSV
jgi:glycosyltransferase involved in cell wall biosynthesis